MLIVYLVHCNSLHNNWHECIERVLSNGRYCVCVCVCVFVLLPHGCTGPELARLGWYGQKDFPSPAHFAHV